MLIRTPYRFYNAMKKNLTLSDDISVNQTQAHTLLILREQGAVSMHVLGRLTGIVKGSLTQVVDALVEARLVERKRAADDRRTVLVSITAEGLSMTDRLDENLIEHTESILSVFSKEQRRKIISALKVIHDSLNLMEKREDNAAE